MELKIRTGSIYIPFDRNAKIAMDNFLNGKPLFENQLPNVYFPDPNGLPEWLTLTFKEV